MKEEFKKMGLIALIAFITFLISYGYPFYLLGSYVSTDGVWGMFIFPAYYLIMTVVALVFMHSVVITKRPYIVMSILSSGFVAVFWLVYFCIGWIEHTKFTFSPELWYPIVLSVLSLIMSVCYIGIVVDIIKIDKKIKRNNQNNKE